MASDDLAFVAILLGSVVDGGSSKVDPPEAGTVSITQINASFVDVKFPGFVDMELEIDWVRIAVGAEEGSNAFLDVTLPGHQEMWLGPLDAGNTNAPWGRSNIILALAQ